MITSILNDALLLRDQEVGKFQDYFKTTGIRTFDPVFASTAKPEDARSVILFILCAYSYDSPLIALRRNSQVEKEGICDYLGISGELRIALMELEDKVIRNVVTQYIVDYAGPVFRSYCFLKIQYDDYELQITRKAFTIKTSSTDKDGQTTTDERFDPKEHGKAVKEMTSIAAKLKELERELKSELAYQGLDELRDFKSNKLERKIAKSRTSGCVESSPLIKSGYAQPAIQN